MLFFSNLYFLLAWFANFSPIKPWPDLSTVRRQMDRWIKRLANFLPLLLRRKTVLRLRQAVLILYFFALRHLQSDQRCEQHRSDSDCFIHKFSPLRPAFRIMLESLYFGSAVLIYIPVLKNRNAPIIENPQHARWIVSFHYSSTPFISCKSLWIWASMIGNMY